MVRIGPPGRRTRKPVRSGRRSAPTSSGRCRQVRLRRGVTVISTCALQDDRRCSTAGSAGSGRYARATPLCPSKSWGRRHAPRFRAGGLLVRTGSIPCPACQSLSRIYASKTRNPRPHPEHPPAAASLTRPRATGPVTDTLSRHLSPTSARTMVERGGLSRQRCCAGPHSTRATGLARACPRNSSASRDGGIVGKRLLERQLPLSDFGLALGELSK